MLNDRMIRHVLPKNKRYELRDEGGLILDVTPNAVKSWRFRYSFQGKDYKLTLGEYPFISLKEARALRDEARRKLTIGVNPQISRKTLTTFGELYEEFKKTKFASVTPDYAKKFDERTKKHILPHHGDTPISEITSYDILCVLRLLEAEGKYEQTRRIKQMYGQILRFGIAIGICQIDPVHALSGAIVGNTSKHFATIIEPAKVGLLMRAISAYPYEIVRMAMQLHAYTFVRPGELRNAEWAEIDFSNALWRIPAAKMKMRRDHIVPLAGQSAELLQKIQPLTGHGRYVFPSPRCNGRPLSDATELAALRSMGYGKEEMTAHGFRGMASTLLHELGWQSDLIEKQLAHEIGSSVAQAYNHAQYLEQRREMMQAWADYLDGLRDNRG